MCSNYILGMYIRTYVLFRNSFPGVIPLECHNQIFVYLYTCISKSHEEEDMIKMVNKIIKHSPTNNKWFPPTRN